ncbi:glycyl-radical enzyme activating protein [Calditrichota bacterium]
MKKGIIFDIKRFAVHDGPGIRTTVFLKGCAANCWWCHNPESQREQVEYSVKKDVLNGQVFESEAKIGRLMTVNEVMNEIEKDRVFYDESGGGVTFSGGEPLLQHQFLNFLLNECKSNNIHTTLDTTGYSEQKVMQSISETTDLFLYDLKFINDDQHIRYTGVSNKVILANLNYLISQKKNIIIRYPMIPTITDTQVNINEIINYLLQINDGIQEVNILPFHKIAGHKYRRFNKEDKMKNIAEPTQQEINELQTHFEKHGFKVKVGG